MLADCHVKNIRVRTADNRDLLGEISARAVADSIRALLKEQPQINLVFAAAPSQNEFLAALLRQPIEWGRLNAFHMDEYIGLDQHAPQSFAWYLQTHLFGMAPFRSVHLLNGMAPDLDAECARYAGLLRQFPIDIVCMGIGENNHLAFNDPPVADFHDPECVKVVSLDEDCRRQQVNDGCFPSLTVVPKRALTLTIPALLGCRFIFAMVPGERKAKAVFHTLNSPVTQQYPSTILKQHPAVQLFLDKDSSKLIML
jgi:glucosamine-6-phosphate deaminase